MSDLVLLVDDDGEASLSLIKALKAAGLTNRCDIATQSAQAINKIKESFPAVVILDLSLDAKRGVISGFELLSEITSRSPDTRTIILTGHGGETHGIQALTLGAANFLEKPADIQHILALIRDGVTQSQLKRRVRELSKHGLQNDLGLIGQSDAIKRLRDELMFLAQNDLAVFIRGETGVGKGLFAASLHQASARSAKPFVRYQPSYGNSDLVNSDLFGHKKGSFTGADSDRIGLFEKAAGGSFFLDELDELPLEVQVTLLGVLQDRKFRPVGSSRELALDARIISASNLDVDQSLKSEKLRRDLFHRLAQETVEIPPLRERSADIAPLIQAHLATLRARNAIQVVEIDHGATTQLLSYAWPGNVRELHSVVERAALRAAYRGRSEITLQDLPTIGDGLKADDFAGKVEQYKISLIEEALKTHNGNQVKASEQLKLDRSSMRRILARRSTTRS